MAPTSVTLGSTTTQAALPWASTANGGQFSPEVLQRMTVWHLMTNTPVHPQEPNVLSLMNTTAPKEMLPSLLARQLAPCLGTIQNQPITLGATSPSEGLSFGGQALPIIPPLALKATLTNPGGVLAGVTNLTSATRRHALEDQRRLSPHRDALAEGVSRLGDHVAGADPPHRSVAVERARLDHRQQRDVAAYRCRRVDPDERHAGRRRAHSVRWR